MLSLYFLIDTVDTCIHLVLFGVLLLCREIIYMWIWNNVFLRNRSQLFTTMYLSTSFDIIPMNDTISRNNIIFWTSLFFEGGRGWKEREVWWSEFEMHYILIPSFVISVIKTIGNNLTMWLPKPFMPGISRPSPVKKKIIKIDYSN